MKIELAEKKQIPYKSGILRGNHPPLFLWSQGKMPVKWMAPESVIDRVYTAQSDV